MYKTIPITVLMMSNVLITHHLMLPTFFKVVILPISSIVAICLMEPSSCMEKMVPSEETW